MRFSVVILFIWKNYKNVPLLLEKKKHFKINFACFFLIWLLILCIEEFAKRQNYRNK